MFNSYYDRNNYNNESFLNFDNSINEESPFFNNELDFTENSFILRNSEPIFEKKESNSNFFGKNLKEIDEDNNSSSNDNIYFLKNNFLNNIKSPNEEKDKENVEKDEILNKTGNNKSTEEKTLTNELITKIIQKMEKNVIILIWEEKEKGLSMMKKKRTIKKVKIIFDLNLKDCL